MGLRWERGHAAADPSPHGPTIAKSPLGKAQLRAALGPGSLQGPAAPADGWRWAGVRSAAAASNPGAPGLGHGAWRGSAWHRGRAALATALSSG